MNTLRTFQGVDVAFDVTLSPSTVDFPDAPAIVAEVHKGDGRPALATFTPTWQFTATDTITVVVPGTATAALPPGNYNISLRLADGSAYLSHDALVVWPGTIQASPLRSLIAPSDAMGMVPDFKDNLDQIDGLLFLLEAATVACERYCEMALVVTDFDYLLPHDCGDIVLRGRPVYGFQIRADPNSTNADDVSLYTDALTNYRLDAKSGAVEFYGQAGAFLTDYGHIWVGRYNRVQIRLTYRGGYAIDPIDVGLGVEPVPKELQSACLAVAISIREGTRTAGPTLQQGLTGAYYTKSATETVIPLAIRPILDRYARAWGVA